MCFKAKVSTPKVKTAEIVTPPAPLTDSPTGVQFGGTDDDDDSKGSSEVSGVSDLKVSKDNSVKNSQADSGTVTKSVSGSAKRAIRKTVYK